MRNSRLRCSSLMNSSFCRKRAMRSSSRYCFSFLSCSVAPVVRAGPPVVPAAPDREPDWAVQWLVEENKEEDDEGWDRLLWELCWHRRGYWLEHESMWFDDEPFEELIQYIGLQPYWRFSDYHHDVFTFILSTCCGRIRRKSSGRFPSKGGFQFR